MRSTMTCAGPQTTAKTVTDQLWKLLFGKGTAQAG
jgi:hypothetical protein